jgi:hypothetical protein
MKKSELKTLIKSLIQESKNYEYDSELLQTMYEKIYEAALDIIPSADFDKNESDNDVQEPNGTHQVYHLNPVEGMHADFPQYVIHMDVYDGKIEYMIGLMAHDETRQNIFNVPGPISPWHDSVEIDEDTVDNIVSIFKVYVRKYHKEYSQYKK